MRRRFAPAGIVLVLAAVVLIVLVRRWVHHAQLELVPVIVPADVSSSDVIDPPPRAVMGRMMADVRDVFSPPQRPRYAVLTFDDGPYPVLTPALMHTLARVTVPAVFFLIGHDATEQPAIALRVDAAGQEIGNHTLSHPEMNTLSFPAQLVEIVDGGLAIKRATGRDILYFRPPHGNFNAQTIDAARTDRETFILWDFDPGDWRQVTQDFVVRSVTQHAKAPAVILLHNGSASTIAALPAIVQAYRRAGFEFITLSELQRRVPLEQINTPISVHVE